MKEVFDTLTASEQTYIRGALGDELDQTLGQPVLAEGDVPTDADVSIFICLDPGVARAVFIAGMISSIEAEEDADLSEAEESYLLDSVAGADWELLLAAAEDSVAALAEIPGVLVCLPDAFAPAYTDDLSTFVDDATVAALGEAMAGELDYDHDTDLFVFEGEQGRIYRIDVELGTVSDSTVALYSADFAELALNDDHGDTLASQITWEAPSSGSYYVALGAYSTGSYTLTVTVSDIIDDHSGSVDGATGATVGEAVAGALKYDDDTDLSVFETKLRRGISRPDRMSAN